MQGLPINLLTQMPAQATGKTISPVVTDVTGNVGEIKSPEAESAFASLFANLIGGTSSPVQTETAGTEVANEAKVVVSGSSNLDQLLQTIKGEQEVVPVTEESASVIKNKEGTALEFLIKESKANSLVIHEGSPEKIFQKSSDNVSRLGLSSEDFVNQLNEVKENKNEKLQVKTNVENTEVIDPKLLIQKNMNQSMKAYGQKQNLLNDNIIKNTNDLAFKEKSPKSTIDELKSPEMKISAELANIKESLIPIMLKPEMSQSSQNLETATSSKILDLSNINTSNTAEIIKRITDYVEQSHVVNKESLDLTVKHDSLGQFKIQVNKPAGNGPQHLDMQITTTTAEGHDFFVKNEIGLMKNLSQAGIQLSDLRIVSGNESMSFAQTDSRQSNNSQNGGQSPREYMSFDSGNSSQGSERRKELWQEAQNQQRYGA